MSASIQIDLDTAVLIVLNLIGWASSYVSSGAVAALVFVYPCDARAERVASGASEEKPEAVRDS